MKKILILLTMILGINLFANINEEKAFKELQSIKRELVGRYKDEYKMDFDDFSSKTANEIRVFNETLYLKFLAKYVKDITNVKVYSSSKTVNILIFANDKISEENFESIFEILHNYNRNKNLKLIQTYSDDSRVKLYGIIQEKTSERE